MLTPEEQENFHDLVASYYDEQVRNLRSGRDQPAPFSLPNHEQLTQAQELLTVIGAESLLEEVRDTVWQVGEIVKSPFSYRLVYSYETVDSAKSRKTDGLSLREQYYLREKYYPSTSTNQIGVSVAFHRSFERFEGYPCIRVADNLGLLLDNPDNLQICRADLMNQLKRLQEGEEPFASYYCNRPDENARNMLRGQLARLCAHDKLHTLLPLQLEVQFKEWITIIQEKGQVYPSLEACIEAAKAEAEETAPVTPATPRRRAITNLFRGFLRWLEN